MAKNFIYDENSRVPRRVQENLCCLMERNKNGLTDIYLRLFYEDLFKTKLDLLSYGYLNLPCLIESLPHIFRVFKKGHVMRLFYAQEPEGDVEKRLRNGGRLIDGIPDDVWNNMLYLTEECTEGIPYDYFNKKYEEKYGEVLKPVEYGFADEKEFLKELNGVLFSTKWEKNQKFIVKFINSAERVAKKTMLEEIQLIYDRSKFPDDCISPHESLPLMDLKTVCPVGETIDIIPDVVSESTETKRIRLFFHLKSDHDTIADLERQMNNFYLKLQKEDLVLPSFVTVPEMYCVAKYGGLGFNRAYIMHILQGDKRGISFVDHGNYTAVEIKDLRYLKKEFADMEVKCVTAEIHNSQKIKWSEMDLKRLKQLLCYGVEDDIKVTIFDLDLEKRIVLVGLKVNGKEILELWLPEKKISSFKDPPTPDLGTVPFLFENIPKIQSCLEEASGESHENSVESLSSPLQFSTDFYASPVSHMPTQPPEMVFPLTQHSMQSIMPQVVPANGLLPHWNMVPFQPPPPPPGFHQLPTNMMYFSPHQPLLGHYPAPLVQHHYPCVPPPPGFTGKSLPQGNQNSPFVQIQSNPSTFEYPKENDKVTSHASVFSSNSCDKETPNGRETKAPDLPQSEFYKNEKNPNVWTDYCSSPGSESVLSEPVFSSFLDEDVKALKLVEEIPKSSENQNIGQHFVDENILENCTIDDDELLLLPDIDLIPSEEESLSLESGCRRPHPELKCPTYQRKWKMEGLLEEMDVNGVKLNRIVIGSVPYVFCSEVLQKYKIFREKSELEEELIVSVPCKSLPDLVEKQMKSENLLLPEETEVALVKVADLPRFLYFAGVQFKKPSTQLFEILTKYL